MIFNRKQNKKEDFIDKQISKIQQYIEDENFKEIEDIIDYIIKSKEYHYQLDEEKRSFLENVLSWSLISQNKYFEAFERMGFFKIIKENVINYCLNFSSTLRARRKIIWN